MGRKIRGDERPDQAVFGRCPQLTSHLRRRVLVVYKGPLSRFIQIDVQLLGSSYDTRVFRYTGHRAKRFGLAWNVLWADVALVWFADMHSWYTAQLCRWLGKKSVIVTGGYDVACQPDIGYGLVVQRPIDWAVARKSLILCDHVIPFSHSALSEIERTYKLKLTNVSVVHLGLAGGADRWDASMKSNVVLTVGEVNKSNLKRKGLETFVRTAPYAPEFQFVLVGRWGDQEAVSALKRVAARNVRMTGYLTDDDLLRAYQSAKVYVQVSRHEGFGLALAEAMLCGCVPVVTDAGSLPEVVGDCGFYVPGDDPRETGRAIKEAARSPLGPHAQQRIREQFPLEKRKVQLTQVIDSLW